MTGGKSDANQGGHVSGALREGLRPEAQSHGTEAGQAQKGASDVAPVGAPVGTGMAAPKPRAAAGVAEGVTKTLAEPALSNLSAGKGPDATANAGPTAPRASANPSPAAVSASAVGAADGVTHVHSCPICYRDVMCDDSCNVEPDLGTTIGGLPRGAHLTCDDCEKVELDTTKLHRTEAEMMVSVAKGLLDAFLNRYFPPATKPATFRIRRLRRAR